MVKPKGLGPVSTEVSLRQLVKQVVVISGQLTLKDEQVLGLEADAQLVVDHLHGLDEHGQLDVAQLAVLGLGGRVDLVDGDDALDGDALEARALGVDGGGRRGLERGEALVARIHGGPRRRCWLL